MTQQHTHKITLSTGATLIVTGDYDHEKVMDLLSKAEPLGSSTETWVRLNDHHMINIRHIVAVEAVKP